MPTAPVHDLVIEHPSRAEARASASATASAQRYPVNDGAGRTVAINVSTICAASCDAADPQTVANFLGTLPHGDEINLLEIDLVDSNLG